MSIINPSSKKQRTIFRILGGILLFLGILFLVIGISEADREYNDFGKNAQKSMEVFKAESNLRSKGYINDSFGSTKGNMESSSNEQKTYFFWLAPIGGFMLVGGFACLSLGFIGSLARYQAGELAPVTKDAINYMGKETKEGVSEISEALFSGLNKKDQGSDADDRLLELKDLLEQGLISESEYQDKRKQIIDEI